MRELTIGNLVAQKPIVQGGMGVGVSLSGLASAVANEGGVGVISAACIGFREPDLATNFREANIRALRKEIRAARALTKGVLGVNVMVALTNFADMVRTAIEEGIDIIFCGAGLPLDLPEYLTPGCATKLVPIVSSGRAARVIAKRWTEKYSYLPDAVVVEGPMAGGHLGFRPEELSDGAHALESILPEVIAALKPFAQAHGREIPVIAAGGIYSGGDIRRFLALGASGVQMASRFVPTEECDASLNFKLAYVGAGQGDIGVIKSPVGMPGRAIINNFLREVAEGKNRPGSCPFHCIKTCNFRESPYCISMALIQAQRGLLEKGLVFAGETAFRSDRILSVRALFDLLMREYAGAAA